jgi:hypothetical protein
MAFSNTSLTSNFNVDPYYDDYDDGKNFHRIMFRPGFAVQGRELNQMQTIVQNQIDRFGRHIFRDGSIVIPGQFNIEKEVDYVKIKDLDSSSESFTLDDFDGVTLTGGDTGCVAYVIDVLDGVETETNTKTLYVRYLSAGTDTTTAVFGATETLTSDGGGDVVTLDSSPTGFGSRFNIDEGIVFAKEHFIQFATQSIILSRYETVPSVKVGFTVTESFVRYTADTSLLDPALGSSNYQAPGADRFKLEPTLVTYALDASVDFSDYVELFVIEDGIIQENYERTQYNILRDEMAKRTFDESGDYYVNGLTVRMRENLDDGTNYGYSNTGNSQLLSVGIEPGVAYVKGYEIGLLATNYITTPKALTTTTVENQISAASLGNYITVNEAVGPLPLDVGANLALYNVATQRISGELYSAGSQAGTQIGAARLKSIEYDSNTLGTPSGNVKIYLYDVNMLGSNNFSNVRSVFYNDTIDFGADVVLNSNSEAELADTAAGSLLYAVGSPFTNTVTDMSFTFRRTQAVTFASDGTVSLTVASPETTPYGASATLTASQKNDIVVVLTQDANTGLTGTAAGTSGANAVVGSGTSFTNLQVGDKLEFHNLANTYTIDLVTDNTNINVSPALTGTMASSNGITKVYKAGDYLDMTNKGSDAGTTRSVVTGTSDVFTFDIKETFFNSETPTAKVMYKASRSTAVQAAKTLKPSRFVKIDCLSAGTTGPFNLGFPDIYQVEYVRIHTSDHTNEVTGDDVTANFIVDNGQRDAFYDHGTITPKNITLTSSHHLLVKLDYFYPDFTGGVGYFDVDSYPVDDEAVSSTTIKTAQIPLYRSPTTGELHDLKNYLDFRSVKAIEAADSTTVGGASDTPQASQVFVYEASGLRVPAAASQLTFDYTYFLPRRDVVVVDKSRNFSIIQGTPSQTPRTPTAPDDTMALATLYIAPFPSLAPPYAQLLDRKDLSCTATKRSHIRQTMRDLQVLKSRVVNLEYYASLNALEKNALDFVILDENGLDRFKNGIFVDTFRDHTLGATYDLDYKIVVDPVEKSIRPQYKMDSLPYAVSANSSGTMITGDLAHLEYTANTLLTQARVSTTRNIETSAYRFIGNLYLSPEADIWVDTQFAPDNQITMGANNEIEGGPIATEWNAWQTKVVGYNIYNKSTGKLLASFTDKDEAFETAYHMARNKELNQVPSAIRPGSKISTVVETVYDKTRTGTEHYNTLYDETESLGNRVIDVDIIPYIRPQTINLNAKGMKANTKVYIFFDGEDMTPNTSPSDSDYTFNYANEGNNVTTNATGESWARLRLPEEKRFRTGTKTVTITDSPTNADDATTAATAYFVANGLVQQKQDTILTTRQVIQIDRETTENERHTTQYTQKLRPSCMAYSFHVKAPIGEEGVFLDSVDVYISARHATYGVWFEIREMNSAGGITRNQVPFSEKWVARDDMTITTDATTPHNVKFPSPVFLYNDTQYAFVIHTEGLNPDTYFWVSRLGDTDYITGESITARPLTGTLFTTNNNLNWDIVPDMDLMCTFYWCDFTVGSGTIEYGNAPLEKLKLGSPSAGFTNYGEPIENSRLTLSSITGDWEPRVGDWLVGQTSGANTTILSNNGLIFSMSNTGYSAAETANVTNSAGERSITATIDSAEVANGILQQYSTKANATTMVLTASNGTFGIANTIYGGRSGATANVTGIDNFRYSVIDIEPSYISFNKTSCTFEIKATSNATPTLGSWTSIDPNENYIFNTEQAVLSRTNEISDISSNPSGQIRATLTTSSRYQSPVIDIKGTHSIFVNNIVNNDTTGEAANTSGGNLANKYISKIVTLAEGQDAEDLAVVLTAYRPPGTDILVYAKLLNNEDGELFTDKNWILMEKLDNTLYSSLVVLDDFKEYSFKFPDSALTGSGSEIQYTTTAGAVFTGFKSFAIKIGLSADDSAVVPRVADLRTIGLQI